MADVLKLVIELVEGYRRDGLRGIEIELYLLFRRQGMDHIADAADEIDGVKHLDGLRAVGHCDRDPVALTHTDGLERLGALLDLFDERFVGC